MRKLLLFCIALIGMAVQSADSKAQWYAKDGDAIVSYGTTDPSTGELKSLTLVIGYSKTFSCRPIASFIVMSGKKLGSPTKQRTSKSAKSQIVIYVDALKFTAVTKQTEYTNGIENAIIAPVGLTEALSIGKNVAVGFGSGKKPDLFTLVRSTGFTEANKKAQAACK